jgi:hypothetical protein
VSPAVFLDARPAVRVVIALPTNGAEFVVPFSVEAQAYLSNAFLLGSVRGVEFVADRTNRLFLDRDPPYACPLNSLTPAGLHTLTAFVEDDFGRTPSPDVQVRVYTNVPAVVMGTVRDCALPAAAPVRLDARVDSGGLPARLFSVRWEQRSGPGRAVFGDPDAAATTVAFDAGGDYLVDLCLSYGNVVRSNTVKFTVLATNAPNAIGYAESFERFADGASLRGVAGWFAGYNGDAVVVATNYAMSGRGRYPLPGAEHGRVAVVHAAVTNRFHRSAGHTNVWIDMIFGPRPWPVNERPPRDTNAQFRICLDSATNLVVWNCPDPARRPGSNDWTCVPRPEAIDRLPFRLTLHGRYAPDEHGYGRFEIYANGQRVTNPAPHFAFANTNRSFLSGLAFDGTTLVDDLCVDSRNPFGLVLIRATAGDNGTIAPAGDVYVEANGGTNFVITPSAFFHVARLLVDGTNVGRSRAYVFTNVAGPRAIRAEFAENIATNGTPERWLARYFPEATDWRAAAMSDADADRMVAWQEYIAGTDPSRPDSFLREMRRGTGPGAPAVLWRSVSNRMYAVYRATDLPAPWPVPAVTSGIPAHPSGTNAWQDPRPPGGPTFYRIGVTLP